MTKKVICSFACHGKPQRVISGLFYLMYLSVFILLAPSCASSQRAESSSYEGRREFGHSWRYDSKIQPGAASVGEYVPLLKDKRVCLLSNQTGIMDAITRNTIWMP